MILRAIRGWGGLTTEESSDVEKVASTAPKKACACERRGR